MAPKKSVQLSGVVVAQSSVSSIDPDAGILMYRGYDIADLAEHSTYEEVAYLLLHGELPSGDELDHFRELLSQRALPPQVEELVDRSAKAALPMDMLRTAVSALAFTDPDRDGNDRDAELRKAARLIAQAPTIVGRYHRRREGLAPVDPDPALSYAENFLTMLHGEAPSEQATRAFDIAMILHAEHEMNASTFTARVIAGTGADVHAAIVGGIAALSGPLHGGANEAAMKLFRKFGSAEATPGEVHRMLERKEKLYGFGHPLYRAYDPRATHPQADLAGVLRGRGRSELVRDHGSGRAHRLRREGPLPERRSVLRVGVHVPRRADRPVHAALRGQPHRRPGGARARAARRQQDHPPVGRVRRPRAPQVSGPRRLALQQRYARERARTGDDAPGVDPEPLLEQRCVDGAEVRGR